MSRVMCATCRSMIARDRTRNDSGTPVDWSIPTAVRIGVRDGSGECVAGLSIVYPTHVVTDAEVEGLTRVVAAAGQDISRRLGALSRPSFEPEAGHRLSVEGLPAIGTPEGEGRPRRERA